MTKPTKELFKVWHSVMRKSYDYNTVEGIAKYRVFRANVAEIKAHNAKNLSWTQGLNEYSDMTNAEFRAHFNLDHTLTVQEAKKSIRGLLSLDDFEEEEAESRAHPDVQARTKFDHRANTMAVRNQGSCGSCWSFATMAIIEGNWNIKNTRLTEHLSTQQLVDCDTGNNGCNGGWYTNALKFFYTRYAAYESTYAYKAAKGLCTLIAPDQLSPVKLRTYTYASNPDTVYALANRGPIAVAVFIDAGWQSYRGGIYTAPCTNQGVNHAVVVVGYGIDCTTKVEYWIIRNSWGSTWGIFGHIFYKDDVANMNSCHITQYAYQPGF
jgi:C1A family cysteine protease